VKKGDSGSESKTVEKTVSPWWRLWGYIKLAPVRYVIGGVMTLGYAASFQLVPLAVKDIVAALEVDPNDVMVPVRWLVIVSIVYAGFRLASRIVMFNIGRQIEFQIRNDYFDHLQRLPQSFFNSHRTGDLMSRAVNDINSVRLFLGMGLLNIIQTPVLYVAGVAVMVSISPMLTFWALLPFPLFIAIARFYSRSMFRYNLAGQEQLGRVSTAVQENASGVLVVRAYSLENQEIERFETQNTELYKRMLRVGYISTAMFTTVGLLPAAASGLVLLKGGQAVQAGSLGSQDLWVFWTYIGMLTFPTVMLGFVLSIAQRGLAALQRLGEILDVIPSIRDRDDVAAMETLEGDVELRDLSFRYPISDPAAPALDGVSFQARRGQTIGIVGPVGSGKSTLVNVIPRLLEVEDGRVFIDGVDINRVPVNVLRSSLSMVPQDSFLFSTTVAENIRFGRPDASMDDVREAARRAHVLEDIEAFPGGFDTAVGERGITLSGGQRQRVALARALLLDPAILILDDSLSSVDHETEEAILSDLQSAKDGRTCFIVAHRISAVQDADLILVLDQGRITERGTHRELIDAGGFYSRLHQRQQLEEQLGEDVA
jgi:ATP-binding cassette subfamily B protein